MLKVILNVDQELKIKFMVMEKQIQFFEQKLQFEIDAWDLHEALENRKNIVLIDARSAEAFEREHIEGSLNLPHRKMNSESTK